MNGIPPPLERVSQRRDRVTNIFRSRGVHAGHYLNGHNAWKTVVAALFLFSFSFSIARAHDLPYSRTIQVKQVFKSSKNVAGLPIVYPTTDNPEATMLYVEIPPGRQTGWHTHPTQGYCYIISGRLTLLTKKETRTFTAGQGFAETVGVPHNGENLGKTPVKLVALFTGERGKAFVVKDRKLTK